MDEIAKLKPTKGLQLNLAGKGLLILAVPLVFQLALVGCLCFIHERAQEYSVRAGVARDTSAALARFGFRAYATINHIDVAISSHAPLDADGAADADKLQRDADVLIANLNKIREIPKSGSFKLSKRRVRGLDMVTRSVKRMESLANQAAQLDTSSVEYAQAVRQEQALRARSIVALTEIGESEYGHVGKPPEYWADDRGRWVPLVVAGIVLNIGIVLLLGLFFSRDIVNRLLVILDNSVRLASDKPLHPLINGSDEIARLDEAFHSMADALTEAMRVKQEVLQMVSHDLRTPLNTVQAFHTMLGEGMLGNLTDKGSHLLVNADLSTKRMLGLVNDLLEIEKMQSGGIELQKADVPVATIFEQSIHTMSSLAESKGVRLQMEPTELMIHADSDRLVQVVMNLLSNAVKFSPANSQVTLSASRAGGYVDLTVADQGRGIPPEQLQSIFDRFKQVSASDAQNRKGFGLGLAICKALVQLHGGEILVDSRVGVGTRFTVRIPDLAVAASTLNVQQRQSVE